MTQTKTDVVPLLKLNDGNTIPQLGFGVFKIRDNAVETIRTALEVGYRHIDTAQMYHNEEQVGEALRSSGLERDEVFITSKLGNANHHPDDARRTFDESLEKLGVDYVNLFLIHWPLPTRYDGDFVSTWNVLEGFKRDERARSIGVSNFEPEHLQRLADESETVPAVNQIEVHPYFTNDAVRAYGRENGILTEAWAPITKGRVLNDELIGEIARRVDRTPAQVVMRWHIQRGDIVFPKTVTPSRMEENLQLFDFKLEPVDMDRIATLDRGADGRIGPHPNTFDAV